MNKKLKLAGILLGAVISTSTVAASGMNDGGKCGAGNTISEMLMIMFIGISMMSTGGFILIKGDK